MWISTAVLMYVIWWYRGKLGSMIAHLFFVTVNYIEGVMHSQNYHYN